LITVNGEMNTEHYIGGYAIDPDGRVVPSVIAELHTSRRVDGGTFRGLQMWDGIPTGTMVVRVTETLVSLQVDFLQTGELADLQVETLVSMIGGYKQMFVERAVYWNSRTDGHDTIGIPSISSSSKGE